MYLPTYVPTYLTAATAFLHHVCTIGRDHDRTGALRPAQLNQLKYLHAYLSTASEDYIATLSQPLMEFATESKKKNSKTKPISRLQSPPPETMNQVNENLKLFYWTFRFSQKLSKILNLKTSIWIIFGIFEKK